MAKTILVVDDDPTQRRLIQAVLERDGKNGTRLVALFPAEGKEQRAEGAAGVHA